MPYSEYKKEFVFYQTVKKEIELIAWYRKFDFFEEEPIEIQDGKITVWSKEV